MKLRIGADLPELISARNRTPLAAFRRTYQASTSVVTMLSITAFLRCAA